MKEIIPQKSLSLIFKQVTEQILYRTEIILEDFISIPDLRKIILAYASALIYHVDLSEIHPNLNPKIRLDEWGPTFKIYSKEDISGNYSVNYLNPSQLNSTLSDYNHSTLISLNLSILKSPDLLPMWFCKTPSFQNSVIYVKHSIDGVYPLSVWFVNWAKILKNKFNCLIVLDSKTSFRSLKKVVRGMNYSCDLWLPRHIMLDPALKREIEWQAGRNLHYFKDPHFKKTFLLKYQTGWKRTSFLLKTIILFAIVNYAWIFLVRPEKVSMEIWLGLGLGLFSGGFYLNWAGNKVLAKEEKSRINKLLPSKNQPDECCSIKYVGARFFNPHPNFDTKPSPKGNQVGQIDSFSK